MASFCRVLQLLLLVSVQPTKSLHSGEPNLRTIPNRCVCLLTVPARIDCHLTTSPGELKLRRSVCNLQDAAAQIDSHSASVVGRACGGDVSQYRQGVQQEVRTAVWKADDIVDQAPYRTDPDSAIPTVDVLLSERLKDLLQLILAIPSISPTKHLQIAFLLRFTSSAREWIAGYPLLWPSGYSPTPAQSLSSQEEQVEATVQRLLAFLRQLDEGWIRLLVADTSDHQTPRLGANSTALTATEKYARKPLHVSAAC